MKHRRIMLLMGAFLFILLTSMKMPVPPAGAQELKVDLTTIEDLRVQLAAQNDTGKKLYLSVIMLEPNVFSRHTETEVYTEVIPAETTKINRTLNLSQLQTGTYCIKIKAGKKRFERQLDIRSKASMIPADQRVIQLQ